jgi:hypothetical protein
MQILLYRNFLLKKKSPFLTWIRIQLEVPYPYVGVSKGDSSADLKYTAMSWYSY